MITTNNQNGVVAGYNACDTYIALYPFGMCEEEDAIKQGEQLTKELEESIAQLQAQPEKLAQMKQMNERIEQLIKNPSWDMQKVGLAVILA